MLEGIKNVVFDIGGVLIDLHKEKCIEAFRSIGFPQIEELIDPYYPAGIFNKLEKGDITAEEVCEHIRQMAGHNIPSEQISGAYKAFIGPIPIYKLRAIRALRDAGYRTYALSNINEMVFSYVRNVLFEADGCKLDDYFEKAYLSYEMHALKPSPEIFLMMIDDSGMKPEETLFIDDGEKNIEAARTMGFNVYMPQPEEDFTFLFSSVIK